MGADLCLQIIAHRQSVTPDHNKACDDIDTFGLQEIQTLLNECEEAWGWWEDIDVLSIQPEDIDRVKNDLKNLIEAIVVSLDDRDVCQVGMCGWWVYITGGMTWGDDPTDTFGTWNRIFNMGSTGERIYAAAGFDHPPVGPEQYIVQEEALPL